MMTAKQYRKKPVVVEAMRYDGPAYITPPRSVAAWYADEFKAVREFIGSAFATPIVGSVTHGGPNQYAPAVRTLEGVMRISPGDWIVKGTEGEFYPCKPAAFAATFEEV